MNSYFYWSDNWWIEDNSAWFVDGECNTLFEINFLTKQCEFVKELPNDVEWKFRQNPRCIKIKNDIVCLPDNGSYIWVYNGNQFEKIIIKNLGNEKLLLNNFWAFNGKIFAVSIGLKQIIEINLEKRRIDEYYSLCATNVQIAGSVKVNEKIFIVSANSNQIYEFDLIAKKTVNYVLNDIKDNLYAIDFDGDKFWLSGYNKAIYTWKKENGSISVIKNFPEGFGIYDFNGKNENLIDCEQKVYNSPVFIGIKCVGKNIWFFPFKTNKILYINKITCKLSELKIEEENETKGSLLLNYMKHKYLIMYVRNQRYIGLFSFKNNRVFEIDTIDLKVESKNYLLSNQYLKKISNDRIFSEYNYIDKVIYQNILLRNSIDISGIRLENVGFKIYHNL